MRLRRREPLFSILLDTGLELLHSVRDRLPDNMDDIKTEPGRGTKPCPIAWAAPPTSFAQGRVPNIRQSGRSVDRSWRRRASRSANRTGQGWENASRHHRL